MRRRRYRFLQVASHLRTKKREVDGSDGDAKTSLLLLYSSHIYFCHNGGDERSSAVVMSSSSSSSPSSSSSFLWDDDPHRRLLATTKPLFLLPAGRPVFSDITKEYCASGEGRRRGTMAGPSRKKERKEEEEVMPSRKKIQGYP